MAEKKEFLEGRRRKRQAISDAMGTPIEEDVHTITMDEIFRKPLLLMGEWVAAESCPHQLEGEADIPNEGDLKQPLTNI